MLEAIMSVPVVVKVLVALGLILSVNRFCRHLIVSVTVAAVVLAAWSGHGPADAWHIAWARFVSADNLVLMAVVVLVISLSSQMAATGVMQGLVDAVRGLVSRRNSMAVLPAVIGLLPMPGGAIFSAPLVDSVDAEGSVSPGLKAQTNHWFRHIWEYWWPLYPGVLLAVDITGLQIWQFMLLGLPMCASALVAGRFFLLGRVDPGEEGPRPASRSGALRALLRVVLPIVVVIAVYGVVKGGHALLRDAWPGAPGLNKYLPMGVGLCAAMAVLQIERPLARGKWRAVLLSPRALNMAAIVAVVRIYGAFIEADLPTGVPLVEQMRMEMDAWGIPVIATVMLLPFVAGLATGITIGFVGATFPIVIPLAADPSLRALLAVTVLAFASGFMGTVLSPVHVCLVVTSEHFETRVVSNVAALLKPAAAVIACALALYFLIG